MMSTYQEMIVNIETGETTFRDFTKTEITEVEKAKLELAKEIAVADKAESDKAILLIKLGISTDEAKLLLV